MRNKEKLPVIDEFHNWLHSGEAEVKIDVGFEIEV